MTKPGRQKWQHELLHGVCFVTDSWAETKVCRPSLACQTWKEWVKTTSTHSDLSKSSKQAFPLSVSLRQPSPPRAWLKGTSHPKTSSKEHRLHTKLAAPCPLSFSPSSSDSSGSHYSTKSDCPERVGTAPGNKGPFQQKIWKYGKSWNRPNLQACWRFMTCGVSLWGERVLF